jgi:hypothetical protein
MSKGDLKGAAIWVANVLGFPALVAVRGFALLTALALNGVNR